MTTTSDLSAYLTADDHTRDPNVRKARVVALKALLGHFRADKFTDLDVDSRELLGKVLNINPENEPDDLDDLDDPDDLGDEGEVRIKTVTILNGSKITVEFQ